MDFETKVQFLHGVGPKIAQRLKKLGVETVHDLLFYFPRRYEDYTVVSKINKLPNTIGEYKTIKVKIINITNRRTSRRRFTVTEAVVADETGSIKIVWFNQPYLTKMLKPGFELILNGKVTFDSFSRQLQMESPNRATKPKIVPIYPETAGIHSYYIAKLESRIENLASKIQEYIPAEIIRENNLLSIQAAISTVHQPENSASLEKAKERMAFDELFLFSLQKQLTKRDIQIHKAPAMQIDEKFLQNFVKKLPFKLTDAQRKSAWQIILDLKGQENLKFKIQNLKLRNSYDKNTTKPMNRLLNGDVGSGKTVVAAIATAVVVKNGFRVALMAPTEILANQHFSTLSEILEPDKISVGLITGHKKDRCDADVVVGTHALISGKTKIDNIALVIIDEQHRFGVSQRARLLTPYESTNLAKVQNYESNDNETMKQSNNDFFRPHFLSMTATPIPRTMSLVVFADLDVSVIDEMPAGRKKIITKVVAAENRQKSYDFIRGEIKKGHQAFVICPIIAEGDEIQNAKIKDQNYGMDLFEEDRKSVTKEYEKLSKEIFPDLKIARLHGKMPATPRKGGRGLASGGKSKQEIMEAFRNGKYDILVSTSVVEVGVDIPNATVMMIEDAERFGLAQLHQFRGRVGRSHKQSYCLLFSSSGSENVKKRLSYMESVSSGFKLAEKDLELRGPGQLYGYQQSGFWEFKFASISDRIMIEKATEAAKEIADGGIEKYPKLKEKVGETAKHLE